MIELIIIIGAELAVLFSVAALNVYRLRTDVLTGSYIRSAADQLAAVDMSLSTGQPQIEWSPRLGDGLCSNDSILIHKSPVVCASPSSEATEKRIADHISALTTLAASIDLYDRNISLSKDTAGFMSADDGFEPNSTRDSDQNAIAPNAAMNSIRPRNDPSAPTAPVPKKYLCLTLAGMEMPARN